MVVLSTRLVSTIELLDIGMITRLLPPQEHQDWRDISPIRSDAISLSSRARHFTIFLKDLIHRRDGFIQSKKRFPSQIVRKKFYGHKTFVKISVENNLQRQLARLSLDHILH